MPSPAKHRLGGPLTPESSRRGRNLYLIEMLLGACLLLLIFGMLYVNYRKEPSMAGANVVEFTSDNWQKEVAESTVPVVVDFWAPCCGPCRQLTPIIDKLATQYAGKVKVGKLNVDDAPDIAARYGVSAIPRVAIFKGGDQPQKTIVGLTSEANLVKEINSVTQ